MAKGKATTTTTTTQHNHHRCNNVAKSQNIGLRFFEALPHPSKKSQFQFTVRQRKTLYNPNSEIISLYLCT
jgi:hypothetical protein